MKVDELTKKRDAVGLLMLVAVIATTLYQTRNISWAEPFYHIQSLFAGKGFMQADITWTLLFLGGSFALLFLSGRVFCGWFCPFGAFLKLFDKIPNKKLPTPEPINDKYVKYFILIGFLFASFAVGFAAFDDFCPAGVLFRTFPGGGGPILTAIPVFLVVAAISIAYGGRTWCKSMCPLGACFAAGSKISLGRVKIKHPEKCIQCMLCQKNCPMGVLVAENHVLEKRKTINDGECINCYNCVAACPMKILKVI